MQARALVAGRHVGQPVRGFQGEGLEDIHGRQGRGLAMAGAPCDAPARRSTSEDTAMSKGLDKKKETKKKPTKTIKEKRAEKNEKKANKGFAPT
ncbi:hypothetical protein LYSHEL_16230 [Lysobacter helvus]|uniref:Uncharacterized protein n=2 Tax=Lysobacteraceae TaxID=32033 RepID=A0ABN6FSD1_9GAMM|nr:hypothetical protein LYSCAS_16230 [Lysobacter caseinilyticus]BCT95752.1 hypothetical protein LYSHEL_16230 [Lysobacter helvus]